MDDHVVGHHPTVPGLGKTAQAVDATRRLEDSLRASRRAILACLYKIELQYSCFKQITATPLRIR
jgi:hypothetical protein